MLELPKYQHNKVTLTLKGRHYLNLLSATISLMDIAYLPCELPYVTTSPTRPFDMTHTNDMKPHCTLNLLLILLLFSTPANTI